MDEEELARSRADFAANVERRLAARNDGPTEPKGSVAVLLTTGIVGTAMLALLVAFLGGGLLYLPALIPLITVCSVLASRKAK
jgi:ABC-type transporter Mla subunit MlaD